jgi:hypothetical protein
MASIRQRIADLKLKLMQPLKREHRIFWTVEGSNIPFTKENFEETQRYDVGEETWILFDLKPAARELAQAQSDSYFAALNRESR